MKKIIKMVASILGFITVILVIGIMISATLSIKNNQPVFIFGYALGVVPTDSMIGEEEDSLNVNDMYIMHKANIQDVTIGDVIVYQGKTADGLDILIVHRIVDQNDLGFITQGDNESQTDQSGIQAYITSDNLVGQYVEKITFLKPISLLVQSNRSYIFFALVIVITILLVSEIIDLMKTYQKEKQTDILKAHEKELEDLKLEMRKQIIEEEKLKQ